MTSLILPVAGASSRYPDVRPKWMLVHPQGDMMLFKAIGGLDLSSVENIYVTMLQEHVDHYDAYEGTLRAAAKTGLKNRVKICVLRNQTKDQPETVLETIRRMGITGPMYVKDSDNYFETDIKGDNCVSVYSLEQLGLVTAGNKSYVNVASGMVANIVEKRVISPLFCCGGYGFSSADEFSRYCDKAREEYPENLYLSHVIYRMMLDDLHFAAREARNYVDWGTLEDWERYKEQFGTIFVDLDGVLVQNSGEFFRPIWGNTDRLTENVKKINSFYSGCTIVITTSRSEAFREVTVDQLKRLGIRYHRIIFGLPHGRRYLINDFAPSNKCPTSVAINIPRNGVIEGMLPRVLEGHQDSHEPQKPETPAKKRIAVCISGLARTFDKTIDDFHSKVISGNHDFDIFLSTWTDLDSKVSTEAAVRSGGVCDGSLSEKSLDAYGAKSVEVEKLFEWDPKLVEKYNKNKHTHCFVPATLFMLYKIWSADLMRRKAEESFGFKYDLVVRTRFDLRMTEHVSYDIGDNNIAVPPMTDDKCKQFNRAWVNDTFAIGTSDAMKAYADLYLNVEKMFDAGVPFQPEIMLKEWLLWNELSVGTPNSYPLILRPSGEISRSPKK